MRQASKHHLTFVGNTQHHTVFGIGILLCCLGWYIPHIASAQGFNWQYSPRFPTEYPTLFVGLHGGYSPYTLNSTNLPFREPRVGGGFCDCAKFTTALGREWRVGVMAEKWLEPGNIALFASVQLQSQADTLRALSDPSKGVVNPDLYPNRTALQTQYFFENTIRQLSLEVGAKYKFYPLPLFVTLGLSSGYIVQRDSRIVERISDASKADYNYPEQIYSSAFFALSPLSFAGTARIGADVPLAKGFYTTPAVFATWQFRGVSSADNSPVSAWTRLTIGLSVALLFGL